MAWHQEMGHPCPAPPSVGLGRSKAGTSTWSGPATRAAGLTPLRRRDLGGDDLEPGRSVFSGAGPSGVDVHEYPAVGTTDPLN